MPDRSERRLEYLDLEQLEFDPTNPRLPSARQGVDRSLLLTYMLESANLLDLMRSIATQDFFPGEPLLVTETAEAQFTVVEGNRRFAACWLLSHPGDAPTRRRSVEAVVAEAAYKPTRLPCLVLPEAEIVGFLGYRHITGIQEWSPLAKARYLARLWNDEESGPPEYYDRLRSIARRIGSKADYVARLLTALALFDEIEDAGYFGIPGLDEETLSFSLLALAMNRPALPHFLGLKSGQDFELNDLDRDNLQYLTFWFFGKDTAGRSTLGESRNVSRLVAIVENEDALHALKSGASLEIAFRLTRDSGTPINDGLTSALSSLRDVGAYLEAGASATQEDLGLAGEVAVVADTLTTTMANALT